MSQDNIHFIVIGIESGSISSNKIVILGTFTKIEVALEFIKLRNYPNIFSNVDILETLMLRNNY